MGADRERPPRLALLILRLLVGRGAREFIEGDLLEEFHERVVPERGPRRARRWFWRQALASAFGRLVRKREIRMAGRGGDGLGHDLRLAGRVLWRRPGYAFTAVATLAVGVGAATSVFSVADWLLFKPVPGVRAPADRLALVALQQPDGNSTGVSYPNLLDLEAGVPAVETLAGAASGRVQVASEGLDPRSLRAEAVTRGYFELLEVQADRGRLFTPEELAPEAGRTVAVISYRMWREDLRGDPSIPGRTLVVNGTPYDVVGVAGREFVGTGRTDPVDLWVPAGLYPQLRHFPPEWAASGRDRRFFMTTVARLAPAATSEQAQAQLREVMERLVAAHPDANAIHEQYRPTVHPGIGTPPHARAHQRKVVATMFAVAGLLLLIACANEANLLVFRNAMRRGETAVRRALGASPRRIARQHLSEALLLSVLAAVLAAGVAWGLNRVFWRGDGLFGLAALDGAPLDLRVLLFALATAVTVPLLFALLPAIGAGRLDVAGTLQGAGRAATGRRTLLRGFLIVLQLSLSLALLVGSLLLIRTLQGLTRVDPGFDPAGLLAFSVDPAPQGYDREEGGRFHLELLARARELPGVHGVTVARSEPFYPVNSSGWLAPPGGGDEDDPLLVQFEWIGPDYFPTLGVPVRYGREFREEEMIPGSPASQVVVMVNESLARLLFGTDDATGRTVTLRNYSGVVEKRVVGVVPDVRDDLRAAPGPTLYEPLPNSWGSEGTLLVRTTRPRGAVTADVRQALGALDPNVPLLRSVSASETIAARMAEERMLARLLTVLAVLAGSLAAVGLYSVVGWSVAERTREIGIRVALGAAPVRVLRGVVGGALALTAVGVAVGYGVSMVVVRLLRSRLFGVGPFDPLAWSLAAGLLVLVALVAATQPALRAAAVDPSEALRSE